MTAARYVGDTERRVDFRPLSSSCRDWVTIVRAALAQIRAPSRRRVWWGREVMFLVTSAFMLRWE